MEIQVGGLDDLEARVADALERIGELQAGTRISSDAFFSEPFMREHTEYDTFAAFCEDGPWEATEGEAVRELPAEKLDDHVASTTEFEDWEAMKTAAAEAEIVAELARSG